MRPRGRRAWGSGRAGAEKEERGEGRKLWRESARAPMLSRHGGIVACVDNEDMACICTRTHGRARTDRRMHARMRGREHARAHVHARARAHTYARTHRRAHACLQASDRDDEGDLEREA